MRAGRNKPVSLINNYDCVSAHIYLWNYGYDEKTTYTHIITMMPGYLMFGQTNFFKEIMNPTIMTMSAEYPYPNNPYYEDI